MARRKSGDHVVVFPVRKGRWRFKCVHIDGTTYGESQTYSTRMNARRAAHREHAGLRVVSLNDEGEPVGAGL